MISKTALDIQRRFFWFSCGIRCLERSPQHARLCWYRSCGIARGKLQAKCLYPSRITSHQSLALRFSRTSGLGHLTF